MMRVVFAVYAAVLFALTHWPKLEVPGPEVVRPDLFAHVGAFGLWTLLLERCGWFGAPGSARNLVRSGGVAAVYVLIDEGLQAIPIVQRHVSWSDAGANVLGVGAGLAVASVVARGFSLRASSRADA